MELSSLAVNVALGTVMAGICGLMLSKRPSRTLGKSGGGSAAGRGNRKADVGDGCPFTSEAVCQAETAFHMISEADSLRSASLRYDPTKEHVLVTGGAGYLGTHTVLVLLEKGYEVTVIDNLANSKLEGLRRVSELTDSAKSLHFKHFDISDSAADISAFLDMVPRVSACYHLAGLKAVGESCQLPLDYYEVNVGGTVRLLQALHANGCRKFVFSSSATVYGTAPTPVTEDTPVGTGIANPYGKTKFLVEEVLRDFSQSTMGQEWAIVILRYFNPVGAHESGMIGEDPAGVPNNLMPYVLQVAIGRRKQLTIFGDDYNTPDGTGVRDYIHVMDLAEGHRKSLLYMGEKGEGLYTFNLGSGRGHSVLEMVKSLERVSGVPIPYHIGPRRPGDLAEVYADASKAQRELGWSVTRGLETMCKDMWRWQQANPTGFADDAVWLAATAEAGAGGQRRDSELSLSRLPSLARRMSLASVFVR